MAISRDTYRYIKKLDKEQLSKYLYDFYVNAYFECLKDFEAAMVRRLADDFNFTAEQIDEVKKGVDEDIESIQMKLVSADDIINGLMNEGKLKNAKREKGV